MQRMNLTIDVTKIQKSRLRQNSYSNRDGQQVNQTLCDMVFVPSTEKVIKETDTYTLKKVGFIAEKGKKDEHTEILGDAMVFEDKQPQQAAAPAAQAAVQYPVDEIDPDDIPF